MTIPDIYDNNYYNTMRGGPESSTVEGKNLFDFFLELLPHDQPNHLVCLDVGCGRGDLLSQLHQKGFVNCFGFDFSSTAVNHSRNKFKNMFDIDASKKIIQGSVDHADLYPAEYFDVIFMTDVVEHLPPTILFNGLKNINRWLKHDGKLIIHTFPTLGLHRIFMTFMTLTGKRAKMKEISQIHCNVQTRKSLLEAIHRAPLICEKMWLQNDLILTSSAYKQMKSGPLKKMTRFLLHDMMRINSIERVFTLIGLAEYAKPSIYCICNKSTQGVSHE